MSKKQIYLFCDAGMSTSIMVNKMMEVVEKHQMPLMITAFPIARAQEVVEAEKPVAILLGPQVKYMYEETVEQFGSQGIPIAVIDQGDYGMMNGEKVLKSAIRLIKANK